MYFYNVTQWDGLQKFSLMVENVNRYVI